MRLLACYKNHFKIDEKTHKYTVNLPSVSTLISWKLGKDWMKNIPIAALKKAQDFGTHYHSIMENYINDDEIKLDEEDAEIANKMIMKIIKIIPNENLKDTFCKITELSVVGLNYTGTMDLVVGDIDNPNERLKIVDYKFSNMENFEYWSWQLSLYSYLLDRDADLYIIRYDKKKKEAFLYEIPRKTDKEIEELIEDYHEWSGMCN